MHSPQRIRVSLGPDPRTFFAVSDQGFRWGGVDDEFHGHVQDWLSGAGEEGGWKPGFEPDGALFGINGGYLITCKGGRHLAWNKKLAQANGYPGLAERLMRRSDKMKREGKWEEKWYDYITLNPYVVDEWAVVWADGTISHNLSKSFKTLFGPVMEYLSARPGFFDAHPTKMTSVPPASSVGTRLHSSSSSSGSGETTPQYANFVTPTYLGGSQTTLNLQPSPYYQRPNPLPSLAEPRPQPNSIPFRPPLRPAQSSPLPVHRPPHTGFSAQSPPPGQPQDTTNDQIHKWLDYWKQFQDQSSQINQSLANGTGGSANVSAFPTSDPTGGYLSGVDPTGLFIPGGGMAMPIDPSSVLTAGMQMGGFDPTGLSYGCTIM